MNFAPIPELLEEIRAGRMVVVVDDEDRENEGDLIMAAELVRPATSSRSPPSPVACSPVPAIPRRPATCRCWPGWSRPGCWWK